MGEFQNRATHKHTSVAKPQSILGPGFLASLLLDPRIIMRCACQQHSLVQGLAHGKKDTEESNRVIRRSKIHEGKAAITLQ